MSTEPPKGCNCRADIEAKLLANFEKAAPEAEAHGVTLQGYGFTVVGNAMVMRGFMPYEAQADYQTKSGGRKVKKLKGTMVFNYCPFCGEKHT